MTPLPLALSRALRCPPARGWRRSRPSIPENMRARMAADEARAWSHSAIAGQLWESGWRLARAIAAADKIAAAENNCCNDPGNAGDFPRRQNGGPAPAGCREPLENTKMKVELTSIARSFAADIAKVPDWDGPKKLDDFEREDWEKFETFCRIEDPSLNDEDQELCEEIADAIAEALEPHDA